MPSDEAIAGSSRRSIALRCCAPHIAGANRDCARKPAPSTRACIEHGQVAPQITAYRPRHICGVRGIFNREGDGTRPGDIKPGTLRGIERDLEPCLGLGWLRRRLYQ